MPPAFATLAAQGLDVGAQLVSSVLIARLLGPAAFGNFVFAMAVAGGLSSFMIFGANGITTQLLSQPWLAPAKVHTACLLIILGGFAFCVLGAAVICGWMQVTPSVAALVVLAVLTMLANSVAVLENCAILAHGAAPRDIANVLWSRVFLVAGVAAAGWRQSLSAALLAHVASAALLAALRVRLVHRHLFALRWHCSKVALAYVWKRSSQLGLGALFGNLGERADLLLVQKLSTPVQVGYYGAALRLVRGLLTGVQALSDALFPGMVKALIYREANRSMRGFVVAPTLAALAMMGLALAGGAHLASCIFGADFFHSESILRLLLWAGVAKTILCFLPHYLVAQGLERLQPWVQAVGACTRVLVTLWLCPRYGGMGAAAANLCSDTLLVLLYGAAWLWWRRYGRWRVWLHCVAAAPAPRSGSGEAS